MIRKPLINALTMEAMVTSWKHLQLLAIFKNTETDATLCFLQRAIRSLRLVKDNRKLLDRAGVEPLRRRRCILRRRVDEVSAAAAEDRSGAEEESGEGEYDEEDGDDEDEFPASDFDVLVVEVCFEAPIERLSVLVQRHGENLVVVVVSGSCGNGYGGGLRWRFF